jgi:hypothetical protein
MLERESKSESLTDFFSHLNTLYAGNDANCIKVIALVKALEKKIQSKNAKNALYGLSILAYSLLEDRSYLSSALSSRFSFFSDDSLQLAAIFKKQSSVFETDVENEERKLIYLSALYQHVKKHEAETTYEFRKTTQPLSTIIETLIQPILSASKTASDIKTLTQKRPQADALKKSFANLPAEYLKIKKDKANRKDNITMREFINKLCQTNHLDESLMPVGDKTLPLGYMVRFATLHYFMTEHESEYTLSSLFNDLSKNALNINHSSEITASELASYYLALRSCIPRTDSQSAWNTAELQAAKPLFVKMEKKIKERINAADNAINSDEPHPYIARFSNLVEMAAQFGITLGLGYMTGTLAQKVISKTLVNTASGIVVYVLTHAEGFAATQVETVIEKNVLPAMLGRSIGYASNLVGSAINISIAGTVYQVLKLPADGIDALVAFCSALGEQNVAKAPYNNPEWAESLLALPDRLVDADTKIRIRNTHDALMNMDELDDTPYVFVSGMTM